MRLENIIHYTKEYIILGIWIAALLAVVFCIGYFIIYRLIMKGQKKPSKRFVFLTALSFCYMVVILGAVFLNRGSDYGSYILHPFYSYKKAWYEWSMPGCLHITLNIGLFIPFGFLLPVWSEKLRKFWKVAGIGLLSTFTIEMIQFFTNRGIFDVDDLINNIIGVLIGYGLSMIWIGLLHKKDIPFGRIIMYLAPTLVTVATFATIFMGHWIQDLGNLASTNSYVVNMKPIILQSQVHFDSEPGTAMVYKTPKATKEEAEAFASMLFEHIGTRIDRNENDIYDKGSLFYAENRKQSVWVNDVGFTYNFTDFSMFDDGVEVVTDADEGTIRMAIAKFGIQVTDRAEFHYNDTNNEYIFETNMIEQDGFFLKGTLSCQYYSDRTIKKLDNAISIYEPYKEYEVISEAEAFSKLEKGQFKWSVLNKPTGTLKVTDVSLQYELDSKGYYQPVYAFTVIFNGNDFVITISAIK